MTAQGELSFEGGRGEEGFARWRAERQNAMHAAALRLGLPLGNSVEVWLANGIRLRGVLLLDEASPSSKDETSHNPRLSVDGTRFAYAEMASCVSRAHV